MSKYVFEKQKRERGRQSIDEAGFIISSEQFCGRLRKEQNIFH